nr:YrzE family protein [Clostridia bacterium]
MNSRMIKISLITALAVFAASFALLLILSAIAYHLPDPDIIVTPSAYLTLGISGIVCGLTAAAVNGCDRLLCGLVSGAALALLIGVSSLICMAVCKCMPEFPKSILLSVIPIVLSCAGAALCMLMNASGSAHAHSKRGLMRSAKNAAKRAAHYDR